jgi:4-hydroxy-4-methyl-2-oxoglutarate aldolase
VDLFERCRRVSTCQLSDGLDRLGYYPLGLTSISPLQPDAHIVGPARTVLFKPLAEVATGERIEYFDYIRPGDVIVIANGGRVDCSSWGGQRSLGAHSLGAVGVVMHGAYRDVAELSGIELPVFGLGPTVAASRHGGMPVAVDVPVDITGCTIEPGDVVVGDASGVIVLPAAIAEEVVAAAEEFAAAERAVSKLVATGVGYFAAKTAVKEGSA